MWARAPLLFPTLAFLLGVVLSDCCGTGQSADPSQVSNSWAAGLQARSVWLVALAVAIATIILARRSWPTRRVEGEPWAIDRAAGPPAVVVGVLIVALLAGFARHRATTELPANHVAHLVGPERMLTRIAGLVVSSPVVTPAQRRNPFLPYEPSARTRFILDATSLLTTNPPTAIRGRVRVTVAAEGVDADLGDCVVVTGWLFRPQGPRNPGERDWRRLNRLQHIYAGLFTDDAVHVRRVGPGANWLRFGARLRVLARGLLTEPFGVDEDDSGARLLDTMVLGQRSAAGRELNQAFLRTGISHFLAVSGFHVGVLAAAVWWFVRWIVRGTARLASLTTVGVVVLYALVAEPNAPILRASAVVILACLAHLSGRALAPLNWLALAALLIVAYDPFQPFRAGFQLSFVATLVLVVVIPRLYRRLVLRCADGDQPRDADTWPSLVWCTARRAIGGVMLVSVCVWAATVPLKLHHFGYFAPLSAVTTVLVLPIVVMTIWFGLLTVLAGGVPLLGAACGWLLSATTNLLLATVEALSAIPHVFYRTRFAPAWLVVCTYALVGAMLWASRFGRGSGSAGEQSATLWTQGHRRKLLYGVPVVLIGLWTAWFVKPLLREGGALDLYMLDVRDGSAALFAAPDRRAWLIDAGTLSNFDVGETVARAARELRLSGLDRIVISHANFDHYSGVPTVADQVKFDRLLASPFLEIAARRRPEVQRLFDLLGRGNVGVPPATQPPTQTVVAGDTLRMPDVTVRVLWPPGDLDPLTATNDRSLVLQIEAFGRRVLLPGDVESLALHGLLDTHQRGQIDLRSDVLVAPHHGSLVRGASEGFYEAVNPQVVIVSTGRDRPDFEPTMQDALGPQIRVLTTRDHGAVHVGISPAGDLHVDTPFSETQP